MWVLVRCGSEGMLFEVNFKNAGWGTESGGDSDADGGAAESRYYLCLPQCEVENCERKKALGDDRRLLCQGACASGL